jgi:prolyl-tRNA editing enzyme YbaK/EbsC (Cys-tRNA(Pro) deacylase)
MATEVLEARVTALELKRFQCPKTIPVDDAMRRARAHVDALGLYSANWKWVPEPYYTWELEQRAKVLGASSTQMLCKSLLLENKKADGNNNEDITNPRFVLVILQYASELDVKKLATSIRKLRPVAERLEESQFDLRVADPDDNDRITGYTFNSVTPFGLQQPVPIILSSAIVPQGYFWMGGGHVHLKLGMAVSDFQKLPGVLTMDCSVPRNM